VLCAVSVPCRRLHHISQYSLYRAVGLKLSNSPSSSIELSVEPSSSVVPSFSLRVELVRARALSLSPSLPLELTLSSSLALSFSRSLYIFKMFFKANLHDCDHARCEDQSSAAFVVPVRCACQGLRVIIMYFSKRIKLYQIIFLGSSTRYRFRLREVNAQFLREADGCTKSSWSNCCP